MAGQACLCSQPLHQLTLLQKRVGKGQKSLLRVRRAVGGFLRSEAQPQTILSHFWPRRDLPDKTQSSQADVV